MAPATAETFALQPESSALTTEAKEALDWLKKKLGATRVTGPEIDEDGDYRVTLVRADLRHAWFYGFAKIGEGASEAVLRARHAVEYAMKNPGRRL